ncbi:MAG: reverse transcriptase-like protein [Candidatus Dormibacteria bacterium]
MSRVIVHTDGGARGNPGPAAIGVVVEIEADGRRELVAEIGEKIGVATNNVAEYRALIRGLQEAGRAGGTEVNCLLDSQLVVEQMNGRFKVKHENVVPLHRQATSLRDKFKKVTFDYVPRAQNAAADALVNAALDGKLMVAAAGRVQEEMDFGGRPASTAVVSARPAAPAAPTISATLELVRRAFRDAVEIPRAPLAELNAALPAQLRYDSELQAWREHWAAALAVGRFALAAGLVSADELQSLEAEFSDLRPV